MKTIKMLAMVIVVVMLAAGFAVADGDVTVNVDTTVTATGGNANQQQGQQQGQQQKQMMKTDRNFLGLPTAPNMLAAPLLMEIKDCLPIYGTGMNSEFSINEIKNMKDGSFLEKKGGLWHALFSRRIKPSVIYPFEGKQHHGQAIKLIRWDLQKSSNQGDKRLGTFNCEGDYGYPLDATLGMCLSEAYEETNTDRVYACYTIRRDTHSSGIAYSGAGGASTVNSNTGQAGSVAATLGTSVAYANIAYDITLVALNRGEVELQGAASKPAPESVANPEIPAAKPEPASPKKCDMESILRRIEKAENAIVGCTQWGYDNLQRRREASMANIDAYACTKDKKYLRRAMTHLDMAKKNFQHPKGRKSIEAHQSKADAIMSDVYLDWAISTRILKGEKSLRNFIKRNELDMNPATLPTDFTP